MIELPAVLRRFAAKASGAVLILGLAGCTTSETVSTAEPQLRVSNYRCGSDGNLTVENFQTSVHVIFADGLDVELPAAPPGSLTRYVEPPYTLLLEGREALWMATGREPLTCRR